MELNPAKMRLLYGFFDFYLKLNEKEEAEVMENIKMLDPDEAEQVLKLPNSYFDRGYRKEEKKEEKKKEKNCYKRFHQPSKCCRRVWIFNSLWKKPA
ncbi:hypothetical protein B4099_1172 [Heyndrickxia coagulans]|uniref:Uncharacterized protein n=1 Tax=Heyndrickxia coagulans TaxID=1398 RepID=A0A150KIQ4_HEYCO|nr:hypothetical protein B4099_1172 [Heyndrickxia coagulans]